MVPLHSPARRVCKCMYIHLSAYAPSDLISIVIFYFYSRLFMFSKVICFLLVINQLVGGLLASQVAWIITDVIPSPNLINAFNKD